jgi:DNA-binding response OmpR family regulator
MSALVLAVVSEPPLCEKITRHLRSCGLTTVEAATVSEAISMARRMSPSLVILGRALNDRSDLSVCQELRRHADPLILFLASGGDDADIAAVLDAGGDDYLSLPCSMDELMARIRALLRRRQATRKSLPHEMRIGELSICSSPRQVTLRGRPLHLAPKEFDILAALAEQADRVVARSELVRRVWGSHRSVKRQTLDVYLFSLRAKIEDNPTHPSRLLTVRGVGYRLIEGDKSS